METPKLGVKGKTLGEEGKRDERKGVVLDGAAPGRAGRWVLGARVEQCPGGKDTPEPGNRERRTEGTEKK